MPKSKYSTGFENQPFERWTILSFSHAKKRSKGYSYFWLCRCECGTERTVDVREIVRGISQSCGCLKNEKLLAIATTHGLWRCSEYGSWDHLKQRCTNPKNEWWHRYGGRGIDFCQGFALFENFYAIVGKKPTSTHSIDRKNNDGNYSCGTCAECLAKGWPMNVRWATPKEQANNTCRQQI